MAKLTEAEARALFTAAKLIADSDEMEQWSERQRKALSRALAKLEEGIPCR